MTNISITQLRNAADWNESHAADAYRDGDEVTYCRLLAQARQLRRQVRELERVTR